MQGDKVNADATAEDCALESDSFSYVSESDTNVSAGL